MSRPLTILNLGAGVQSTTVALMAVHGELPPIDHAIFADTQWEPAAVYAHLDRLTGILQGAGIRVHRVTAGNIRPTTEEKIAREVERAQEATIRDMIWTMRRETSRAIRDIITRKR